MAYIRFGIVQLPIIVVLLIFWCAPVVMAAPRNKPGKSGDCSKLFLFPGTAPSSSRIRVLRRRVDQLDFELVRKTQATKPFPVEYGSIEAIDKNGKVLFRKIIRGGRNNIHLGSHLTIFFIANRELLQRTHTIRLRHTHPRDDIDDDTDEGFSYEDGVSSLYHWQMLSDEEGASDIRLEEWVSFLSPGSPTLLPRSMKDIRTLGYEVLPGHL